MAQDINYSPEHHDSESVDFTYLWWCSFCSTYHATPKGCPFNFIEDWTVFDMNCIYETCPHCGQLIKREA